MSTGIEWTDETWNPLTGCTAVSEGCRNCYAAREAAGRLSHHPAYKGLAVFRGTGRARHAVFTGEVRLQSDRLDQPLRWKRPRRVFVNSMSDLFHEDVPNDYIDMVFATMAACPQHTFQVLTKRPERMAAWALLDSEGAVPFTSGRIYQNWLDNYRPPFAWPGWPLPNVWLGTSVEDQATADERIPHLLRVPAVVRFLSCEPLLGPLELKRYLWRWLATPEIPGWAMNDGCSDGRARLGWLQWLIVGGESGPGARPFEVAWARSLITQCREAGVACFVKQLGAEPRERTQAGAPFHWLTADKKGGDPAEWPADLRVREWP